MSETNNHGLRRLLVAWTFIAGSVVPCGNVLAQLATGAEPANTYADQDVFKPQIGEGPIVKEIFLKSRTINSIILALSAIVLLLFIYFVLTIKGQSMAPPQFVDEVNKLVRAGNYEDAADYCRKNGNIFVASIVQRCMENSAKPHAVLMGMVDTEGRRRADVMWNRISYLADVSNVAPMLGLLGTVVGMIEAFYFALPEGSASISSQVLSSAIGGAMATTMFGLIVGILALIFHSIVKGRLTRALGEAERVAHAIADQIKRESP